ncbi:unnamed protein product [Hermetia illucens]|uniref:BTB domain-containing protein n=1 Tax=Hermetia illucens TaxID=343691 RepID=A0A7R8YNM2_HERIL|nr:kelch repeat and BTB domain-containing protein 2-like [Hermetia illucens]CAD7079728.1 unnamed protein product [Hermetia illucens]
MNQLSQSSFDLVLRVRGKEIPVHKLKLVDASKYFEGLFSGYFADSGTNVINLDQFETAAVEMVVEFIYTGQMELSVDTVADIFEVADFLQVEDLLQLCERFFIKSRIRSVASASGNLEISAVRPRYKPVYKHKSGNLSRM